MYQLTETFRFLARCFRLLASHQKAQFHSIKLHHFLASLVAVLFFYIPNVFAGQASLGWTGSTSSNVGGYIISYGQTSQSYTTNVDVGMATSYNVANLTDGQTYYFAVKSYDTTKTTQSSYSNEVSKTLAPVAQFSASPTTGTATLVVTFDASATTGTISSYAWNFGDGTTGTGKTAVKSYSSAGTYSVSLTVTNPGGSNTATKTNYITVSAPSVTAPTANFNASPTSGTAPLSVQFTNSSTNATSYSWNFGDGGTSTSQSPSHSYTTAGTYTVTLIATGSGGSNTKTQAGYITVSSGSTTTPPTTPPTTGTGLVAAYGFEEGSGLTVADASGNDNQGMIGGATWTTGKFGKALSFDGVSNWVTVNDTASLDLTTGMTLEAWVNPTTSMSGWSTVLMKETNQGFVYFLDANSHTNNPGLGFRSGSEWDFEGGAQLQANQWSHLAASYDGTVVRLYINGSEVDSWYQSGKIETSNGVLRIGGNSIWGEYFKGAIDEVRIYNRALSASEIQTDMNKAISTASTSNPPTPTQPQYMFGSQEVLPAIDYTPQGVARAFPVTAAGTGSLNMVTVYVDATATAKNLIVGVYSDANGHPGTLLAQSKIYVSYSKRGQWNDVSLPAVAMSAGKTYWIAMLSSSGTLKFRDYPGNGPTGMESSSQTSLKSLPSTWKTGQVYVKNGPASAYGTGN